MNRWLMQMRQAFVLLPVIGLLVGCQSARIKSGPLPDSISRMHNIVIAIRAYADDHQGRMPPLPDITSLRTALRGYIHDAETFTDSSAGGTGFVTNANLPARLDEVVSAHPEEWVIGGSPTSVADDFVVVASVVGSGSTCAKEVKKILRAKRIRFGESGAHGVSGFSVRVTDKKRAIEALKRLAEKYPKQLLLAAE